MNKIIIPFLLLTVFLTACDKNIVYSDSEDFDLNWSSNHEVLLKTEELEPGDYQEILIFRYGEGFPFSDLKVHLISKSAHLTLTDNDFIINITDKDGNYTGDGLGDIWDTESILDTITVEKSSSLHFNIAQLVIDGNLPMVMEVGLKLKKLTKE